MANRVCINGSDFISYSLLEFCEVCWFRLIHLIFEVAPQKILKWYKIRGSGWPFFFLSTFLEILRLSRLEHLGHNEELRHLAETMSHENHRLQLPQSPI